MTPERKAEIEKLNRLVEGIDVAMLVTADADGRLRARPMGAEAIDAQGSLWFLSSASSHKIDEVKGHQQVNVAFTDRAGQRYVSLSGPATLIRDRERVEKMWKAEHRSWFPAGKDDPDLALLRVDVERAEYWDTPLRTMIVLFEYARSMLTGRPVETSHHESIDLR